tara:strand:+ start:242 stop:979 length:738 start_codon:yes stop_codon:yes gene_type:complete
MITADKKELSVVFPIYNEEETIEQTLLEWKNTLDNLKINYELILAEDGSTDKTKEILNKLLLKYKDVFVSNIDDKKRGYSNAIISSINLAIGDCILFLDSDGQVDSEDFVKFWKKKHLLEDGILIGNRVERKDNLQRFLMSKAFLILHRILFFSDIKDPSCPYILCKKNFAQKINPYLKFMIEGCWWGFTAICIKKKMQINQIDINHRLRKKGKTNVFLLHKIPSIALRNIYGLLKLRFLSLKDV